MSAESNLNFLLDHGAAQFAFILGPLLVAAAEHKNRERFDVDVVRSDVDELTEELVALTLLWFASRSRSSSFSPTLQSNITASALRAVRRLLRFAFTTASSNPLLTPEHFLSIGEDLTGTVVSITEERAFRRRRYLFNSKTWHHRADGRVRSSHLVLGGITIDVRETFSVGGERAQQPRAISLSAGQRIGCRCFLEYTLTDGSIV